MNEKVYIHEVIDIIGANRARYMYHMTANYNSVAMEERHQLCYGVWGVVGSTKRWPEVVNLWELNGLDGLARTFRHEFDHPTLQDPKLARWWAAAAELRRSGVDRVLVPAPWTRTIEELVADGVRGEAYAHEHVRVPPGTSASYLELVREEAAPVYERFGWELTGAWTTAMVADSECILLWTIPTWEQWGELERAGRTDPAVRAWRAREQDHTASVDRFLLVDSELSPMRIGRQPTRHDQRDAWDE